MPQLAATFSPGKRRIFWLIVIVVPFLILIVAEVILRILDYGGNLDLVIKKQVMGKEYYTLNNDVARRYFTQEKITIPEPYDDIFEINKQPATKRIFMLGESTMAGFPYDYTATAPYLLKNRLERLLPQFHFEVVNAALSAVNSYTVVDFMEELMRYQPDAFIVYVGHNEFYGALGVGSTEYLGKSRTFVRLYLVLQNSRVFRLVRDIVNRVRHIFHPVAISARESLMEVMAGSKTILFNSDEYIDARNNFTDNLQEMADLCRKEKIPLVLSTVTSNIRDQEPFSPVFSPSTSAGSKSRYEQYIALARTDTTKRDFGNALLECDSAQTLDPFNATAHFLKARCLDSMKNYPGAKVEYETARDYDGLRFRATTEFNRLIKKLALENSIPLADADSAFNAMSPQGMVGKTLMLEHLHPNYDGYLLLAKTFLYTLANQTILADKNAWHWSNDLSDEQYKESSGVTEFDLETGRYKILSLINRWPFTTGTNDQWSYHPQTLIQKTVQQYMQKQLSWSKAHFMLADSFHARGDDHSAMQEYFAVAKVQPYYYFPTMMMGDLYRSSKKDSLAEEYYRRALQLEDSPFLHVRLGMLSYDQNKFDEAIRQFQLVFASEDAGREKMDPKSRALTYYFLGVTYGKRGDVVTAKSNLEMALQLDPSNNDVRTLLDRLK